MQTGESCEWTNDSHRFILSNFDGIRHSPTSMYRYILPFCPSSSWLHKWHTPESLQEVKVVWGRPDRWGTYTRVVSFGHHLTVLTSWRDIIAVGLDSGDIILLDETTGSSRSVLSGNLKRVTSLAFSIDGTLLVSASSDDTIRLWDIQTGGVVKKFHATVSSVAISSDSITIASASYRRVRLWDIRVGECYRIIDISPTQPGGVTYLDFLFAAPGRLMTICGGLIQQWDITSSKSGFASSGHHISFSSDGKRFVLCDKPPPTIRDTVSGTIITTLHSPGQDFSRCCFSPGDEFVAGVAGEVLYVWNVTGTPSLIKTFVPGDSRILSLVYSSSLISTHDDRKIRFRRIDSDSPDLTTRNTQSTKLPWVRIVYTSLQADEGIALSVDMGGSIECWDLSTGLTRILLQIPEIHDVGGVRLVDGTLTIVYSRYFDTPDDQWYPPDWSLVASTWDVKAGRALQRITLPDALGTLDVSERDYGMSKDGTAFFMVNREEIRTWSTVTGEVTGTLNHHEYTHGSTPRFVDLDGPMIWIPSLGRLQAWGWDLRNLASPPLKLSKIPNGLRLVYLRDKDGIETRGRIIDTTSQTEVFQIPQRFVQRHFDSAGWDGRYLVIVYKTGEVLAMDFGHIILQ